MINHPNRSKLYVVLDSQGEVIKRDCTIAEAAQVVMGYDGHEYDIRQAEDGNGFELWTSRFSRNSLGGGRPLVKSVLYSVEDERGAAEAEIYKKVAQNSEWWKGCDVLEQSDYDAEMARLAAEND